MKINIALASDNVAVASAGVSEKALKSAKAADEKLGKRWQALTDKIDKLEAAQARNETKERKAKIAEVLKARKAIATQMSTGRKAIAKMQDSLRKARRAADPKHADLVDKLEAAQAVVRTRKIAVEGPADAKRLASAQAKVDAIQTRIDAYLAKKAKAK